MPYDFVRLGGRWGSCFADDYRAGGEFLLFFKNGDHQWSPLAAVNEEVWAPNDPWGFLGPKSSEHSSLTLRAPCSCATGNGGVAEQSPMFRAGAVAFPFLVNEPAVRGI